MELEEIQGVGPKTVEQLEALDNPVQTLLDEDVARITTSTSVSTGKAIRITRNALRKEHGECQSFLATDRAEEIYHDLLSQLQQRAVTDYAKTRLKTLYPSTSSSRITEVREEFSIEQVDTSKDINSDLSNVSRLRSTGTPYPEDRCIVTRNEKKKREIKNRTPNIPVHTVSDAAELRQVANDYATVFTSDESLTLSNVFYVEDILSSVDRLLPEKVLCFFGKNKETISAAINISNKTSISTESELDKLQEALDRIDETGSPTDGSEINELSTAVSVFDEVFDKAEYEANQYIESQISDDSVSIAGDNLLTMAQQQKDVDTLIADTLTEEYEDALEEARRVITDELPLTDAETAYIDDIFPAEPQYPVETDSAVVDELKEQVEQRMQKMLLERKQEIAQQLIPYRETVESLVADVLEYDVSRAITLFSEDWDCSYPTVEASQVKIKQGQNPLLDKQPEDVEPVDYNVSGVTLLSGVNSGGKTALLDLIAVITILGHMGLPVPAKEAYLPEINELHYYEKTQGTLDAGAFEGTLKQFNSITSNASGHLVLVDELESITEPGASAKIIAGVLESLHKNNSTGVFVSHVADTIRDECDFDIQVDGIKAHGITDGELCVDRTPVKNHLAQSTPELIVKKLHGETDDQFYTTLLEKF